MHKIFQEMFIHPINEAPDVINGIPFFDSDGVGDQFTEQEVDDWYDNGLFQRNWNSRQNFAARLLNKAADLGLPIIDIASGPGLGLLPGILARNSDIAVMTTDACSYIVRAWQKFFMNNPGYTVSFASFDARNMPIKSESADVLTSFLGFSSIRYGGSLGNNRNHAIKEAYRILKKNGHVFTIESRYEDLDAVSDVFRHWGRDSWITHETEKPWSERFIGENFVILDEYLEYRRKLLPDDNDLGIEAHKAGIEINLEFKAYHLQKK